MQRKEELVILKESGYTMDNWSMGWLDTLLSFCIKEGVHSVDSGTPLSQMVRYVSDGKGLLSTQSMTYDYDETKGTFVGEAYWVTSETTTMNVLSRLYSQMYNKVKNKDYFFKVNTELIRVKDLKLEYLLNHYNGTFEMCSLPLETLDSIALKVRAGEFKEVSEESAMLLYEMSEKAYRKVMTTEEGLKTHGFEVTNGIPWRVSGGQLRLEIYSSGNNFKSLTLDTNYVEDILDRKFSL